MVRGVCVKKRQNHKGELYPSCSKPLLGRKVSAQHVLRVVCLISLLYNGHSRGLRRGSAAARLLGLKIRIPPAAWMSVCCECCVLSGRGLCEELITRPEESYRAWCVAECDLETS